MSAKKIWIPDKPEPKNSPVVSKAANTEPVKTETPKVTKETKIETLPSDVTLSQEEKRTGAKRIAPDRVPHQQLTAKE
jgi:hypothetical protein